MSRDPRRPPLRPYAATSKREVAAVVLLCAGILTVLSLLSYVPRDLYGSPRGVANWIGPSGAAWADHLLQALGLGAYALGVGLLLAGWRAFFGHRVTPGLREAGGLTLLVVAIDALAFLLLAPFIKNYPAGGIPGILLGPFLLEHLAPLGALIVAGSLGLLAVALTADGILLGLGWRGVNLMQSAGQRLRPASRHTVRYGVRTLRRLGQWGAAGLRRLRPQLIRRLRRPAMLQQAVARHAGGGVTARFEPLPTALAVEPPATQEEAIDDAPVGPPVARGAEPTPRGAPAVPVALQQAMQGPQIVEAHHALPAAAAAQLLGEAPLPPLQPAEEAAPQRFTLPSPSLLDYRASKREPIDPAKLRANAERLTQTLKDYHIDGYVREIRPGPVVTLYEYVPGPGIKLSKIASLADDLAMSMEALRVRIVAPIPGKGAVGIEIPNETRETVFLKEIIANDAFAEAPGKLTLALGKDIEGAPYVANMASMPHLLVAGATGAGKSVSVNAMIMSLLFRCTPDDVRMLMVDPKMLELSVYDGIPHLLLPVVTDPKKAALALRWAVEEMERRYEVLSETGARSIDGYNAKVRDAQAKGAPLHRPAPPGSAAGAGPACERMPYLLVIVDELADLMMVASREVETSIMRLAQMARAAGIHLILATQRPSVDVLTGVIKANFPTRIAFQVASRHDSRTIIDGNGAEHLLGRGDMLFMSPGAGGLVRVHGAYVSEEEIGRAVAHLKAQGTPQYDESILEPRDDLDEGAPPPEDFADDMYDQAVAVVAEVGQVSVSMIQRRLRIGYNRSARMVDRMEREGVVGPAEGCKPRAVLIGRP